MHTWLVLTYHPPMVFKLIGAAAATLLVIGACSKGPGALESYTVTLTLDSAEFRPDGPDIMSQTFRVPAITASVVESGTVAAYLRRDAESERWSALPFAYQAPDKSASILTYRYAEGEFQALVVSPNDGLRAAIVQRVGGSRIKVVITD